VKTVWETPVLRAKTSTGKAKFWQGLVLTDGTDHFRSSLAWTENAAGETSKPLESVPARVEPKNVGRANETTPFDQAVLEVRAKMAQKIDKGYAEPGKPEAAGNGFVLPMLAHTWAKKKHLLAGALDVLVQPKLDGVRMLYNSAIGHWTRQGKPFAEDVVAHLRFDTFGRTLDGELMLPDGASFQETVRAVKKYRPGGGGSERLVYRVYDVVDETLGALERQRVLAEVVDQVQRAHPGVNLAVVPTLRVRDEATLLGLHQDFVAEGYEGTIVRTIDGAYTPGHRSTALLKHKDFEDAEFPITGYGEGVGKDEGTIIFTCAAGDRAFQVRPTGTVEERRAMFEDGATYVGKSLTVRYQGVSEDGVPRFPIGIIVREEGL
jgi:DNA ligase-1